MRVWKFTIQIILSVFILTPAFAQRQVSGVVLDETGSPLPGATIMVKGAGTGTITDVNGAFKVEVPDEAVLTISFIGYSPQEVPVGDRSYIEVQMEPDISALEEVVVVGYGTMKKKDLTGAVASIRAEDIQAVKVADAVQALQGKAAGVDVYRNSGRAGGGFSVKIRGESSLTGSTDPLYIVDGVYYDQSIDINPNDIASIDILKDASATSIYGPRGANGVVIITTKRGTTTPSVQFNYYGGVTSPLGDLPAMNREQYLTYLIDKDWIDAWMDDPSTPRFSASPTWGLGQPGLGESVGYENGTDYDWVDGVLRNGFQQDYNLSFSGQTDLVGYSLSVNHYNEKGLYEGDHYKRYGFRANVDAKMTSWLKLGLNTIVNHSINNLRDNPLGSALSMSPLVEPFDAEGNLVPRPKIGKEDFTNPFITALEEYHFRERRRTGVFATAYAEFTFLKDFTFRSSFNVDMDYGRRGIADEGYPGSLVTVNYAEIQQNNSFDWVFQNVLTYRKNINRDHSLTVTLAHEALSYRSEEFRTNWTDLELANSQIYAIGTAGNFLTPPYSFLNEKTRLGGLYRVNYNFRDKYLVSTSGRVDAASQLATGNKISFFPSASVGWNVHNEAFFPDNNTLTSLKIRGGWGITGNEAVSAYSSFGLAAPLDENGHVLSALPLYYEFGITENPASGFRPITSANYTLGWEETAGWNFGVDVGLFKDRVQLIADVYATETTDLLQERALSPSSGILSIIDNVGSVENKGIELTLQSVNINTSAFKWSTNVTFFAGRDEISGLSTGRLKDEQNGWFVGERINVFYDRKFTGIWQLDEQERAELYGRLPGDIKYLDLNGDTTISDADRVILGSRDPDWIGGLTNRFEYKNFDLSIFVFARIGHTVRDEVRSHFFGNARELPMAHDYWTPNNPTNDMPSPSSQQIFNRSGNADLQRINYRDGSYVKIRDITLGYNLPASLLDKLGIQSLRIYATAQNAFVFSKFFTQGNSSIFSKGTRWDPEIVNDQGEIRLTNPAPKMFGGGINVKF